MFEIEMMGLFNQYRKIVKLFFLDLLSEIYVFKVWGVRILKYIFLEFVQKFCLENNFKK